MGNFVVVFYPTKCKRIVCATLSLIHARFVLVAGQRRKSTESTRYYVVNSIYMLNIRPKLFENESPVHHTLRFTQGCGIDQILMIREQVYFIAKENSLEFIEAFHYRDKFLIGHILVTMWFAQYY